MDPKVETSPEVTPFTCQVTAVVEALVTVDVNCWTWLVETLAVAGLTVMVTAGDPPQAAKGIRASEISRTCKGLMDFLNLDPEQ